MRRSLIALLVLLTGCYDNDNETSLLYHDDGRMKPRVAMVPVSDRSGEEFAWSLSDELTHAVYQRMARRGNFCLSNIVEMRHRVGEHNPFSPDVAWMKKTFNDVEFAVFTELMEHHIHAKEGKNSFLDKLTPSCELDMTVRLRVFDMRGEKPEVILQEMIRQTHMIPKQDTIANQDPGRWKQKTYTVSPLGFSHYQLSKEIVSRVEDYILLAKTKR